MSYNCLDLKRVSLVDKIESVFHDQKFTAFTANEQCLQMGPFARNGHIYEACDIIINFLITILNM